MSVTHTAEAAASGLRDIRTTTLSNGLLVLTERMEHVRSVSMGVWLNSGSRDESAKDNGISHFVEHMVFKGTATRSAQQFAEEVDKIGGNLDAFTSKETVCFNIKVLNNNVKPALDLLSDLVLHPTFAQEELSRERGVILEEIKMDEDNPDYLVHELFTQNFWKDDALGRPILGTSKTVSTFDRQTVVTDYSRRFVPQNLVFSAAGNIDHAQFVDEVAQYFGLMGRADSEALPDKLPPTIFPHITLKEKKSLEQVQFCLGIPAPHVAAETRYALYLLNTMLGGGMSSRLFQTIREERGLAYSIYSEVNSFRDTGSLCIYAGTSGANTGEVLKLTLAELNRFKEKHVPDQELQKAKEQLKSNMLLGLETSSSRMSSLARQQMYFGRFFSFDDLIAQIEQVTPEDIQSLARQYFQSELVALTLLGPLGSLRITQDDLNC